MEMEHNNEPYLECLEYTITVRERERVYVFLRERGGECVYVRE